MTESHSPHPERKGLSRRRLLLGGAVAGLGAVAAIGADVALNSGTDTTPPPGDPENLNGASTVPFFGEHQAGIASTVQSYGHFVALDLVPPYDRGSLTRMMRILTDDAARLSQGQPALADSEPELGVVPANLTVTFGFGPRLVIAAGGAGKVPQWLTALPAFTIDRLEPAWSDGDLLLQISADDAMTVAHATRMLLKDARGFASVRWSQSGFRRAYGSEKAGTTMRNLFGQVDGTSNPVPGSDEFDRVVWSDQDWLAGGTSLVIRRTRMDLDKWDRLDRSGREQSVGRYLSNGAPLTGREEQDEPDFEASTAVGFPVIPEFSHLRRARS